ncbi:MAG: T9SS type A sorting domain-containing protein [Flavobacteriales bacterium]|nr:T9SS type A sorting domain-containing protein [Flavobacteriales bacterium]
MRSTLLSLFSLVMVLPSLGQNNITLEIDHIAGDQAFALNQDFILPGGYEAQFTRLQYYLCDFTITHDGGQETFLTETHILVNADDDAIYDLGSWNINQVEAIEFAVGIDPDFNHLDPATYENGHPLAYQAPSMHWGWTAGYFFTAGEGFAGDDESLWQIHALGDANFFHQSHTMNASAEDGLLELALSANYAQLFIQLNISEGLIEHSEVDEATDLLENMRDFVFSPAVVSVENLTAATWKFYPNPANAQVQVSGLTPGTLVSLLDLSGRTVFEVSSTGAPLRIDTESFNAGVYFFRVSENGQSQTQKLVIQ